VRETHGRWPWVAAAAAAPCTVAVARGEDPLAWAALPALLWHQTEEWVWPGGFLPWFNREVAGGSDDEYPITRRMGLAINVGLGWGAAAASGALGRPWITAWVAAMNAGNAALHGREALAQRRYNPGLVTASTLLGPLAAVALTRLARDAEVPPRQIGAGVGLGALASAGMFAAMRRRART
jgi:uncharacterized protein with HXXEE motif